jgi:hypothetical protein
MYAGKSVRVSEPELFMVMFLHLSKEELAHAAITLFAHNKLTKTNNKNILITG